MKNYFKIGVPAGFITALMLVLYFSWSSESEETKIKATLETIRQDFSQPPPKSLMAKAKNLLSLLDDFSDDFEAKIGSFSVNNPNELKEFLVLVSQVFRPIQSTLGYENIEVMEDEAMVHLRVTIVSSAQSDQHKPEYLLFIRLLKEGKKWKMRSVSELSVQ